jgi:hypothetical protein
MHGSSQNLFDSAVSPFIGAPIFKQKTCPATGLGRAEGFSANASDRKLDQDFLKDCSQKLTDLKNALGDIAVHTGDAHLIKFLRFQSSEVPVRNS